MQSWYLTVIPLLAALVGLVLPSHADVIDDFSGPRKFGVLAYYGVPSYEFVDGQLRTTAGGGTMFGYVRNYALPENQPVQFQVDLLPSEATVGGLTLMVGFVANPPEHNAFYIVGREYTPGNEGFAVLKAWDGGGCEFIRQPLPPPIGPETMSLSLTRQGDTLKMEAKLVSRDNPNEVITSRTFTDGPGRDATMHESDPDSGPPFAGCIALLGLYYEYWPDDADAPWPVSEIGLDNLSCSHTPVPWQVSIRRTTITAAVLEWEGFAVPFSAESVNGPWLPRPEKIMWAPRTHRITLPLTERSSFVRLEPGFQIEDSFDGSNPVWWEWEVNPPLAGESSKPRLFIWEGQGQCRIQGFDLSNADFVLAASIEDSWRQRRTDCVSEVDIVDWDETMVDAGFGILLRVKPAREFWVCREEGLPRERYGGLLTFRKSGDPAQSALTITGPDGQVLAEARFPAVDPARQYRLRFGAAGDSLKIQLFDLEHLDQPVRTCEAADGRVAAGMPALYGTKSSGDTYDVTIDRYMLTGPLR